MSAASVTFTATFDSASRNRRSRIIRLVTLVPSRPAIGESFTAKRIDSVGGSIGCAGSGSVTVTSAIVFAVALLFVTLPFVVRSVQPVLLELDREVEEAAASLGATNRVIFTSVIAPALLPAMLSGAGLAFSRAIGEFGSVVLIGGAVPGETEVS